MSVHYYRELLNFCAKNLKDRDAAADLVQEVYARFLAVGRSGETVLDPRALLYRTARNLLTDHHRRSRVRDHESLEQLTEINLQLAAEQRLHGPAARRELEDRYHGSTGQRWDAGRRMAGRRKALGSGKKP